MDAPSLVIPVRMDIDKALKQLQNVGQQGTQAGAETKKGMEVAQSGVEKFHDSVGGLIRAQMGIQTINTVANAIGSEFKRAADYCKQVAMEFSDLREAMQQVAALKGQANSIEFTVSEAKNAAKASLTPQEWKTFQEQFQSFGGAYLEGDQSRLQDRGGLSANDQAEQYQQQISEFAKARGLSASDSAQLGGALLQFSSGPQKTEDLMSRFGKVFKTLERAPTPVAQLLPQMSRVMAQGASPEEVAQMLAITSEAMPGEEETGVTNTIKAITNQVLKGKGDKLGQKKGMSRMEQIKAAVGAIKNRVNKGEDLDAVLHEIAPDLREMRGVKGFLGRGLEAGGFERTEGYQRDTPADFIQTTLTDYEQTDSGQKAKRDADEALAKAEAGVKYQDVEAILQKARTRVIESGDLQEGRLANVGHQALGMVSGVDVDQQRINTQAIEDLREAGRRLGLKGSEFETGAGGEMLGRGARSQYSVNLEIRDLLRKIEEKTGQNPALTALPAGHSGLRQAN